ncbi:ExbD/TolR family protein [Novosphingobium malaysiense]|uniref:Biopolymer transporter ExbD n=1 Tax=Novosphingobium malaysiense TaxID=1348853 RepID=A0A0B1ZQ48_9SPHN|nr:biopolymer transporter ExbD [Novosphingobium malaysiense]KHK92701.1 biopolymer transporter ExbD [Novosphingobium malaysiense]
MHSAASTPSTSPIAAINTTPLIDVMLVLLIMFVITIPAATNSIDIDLPVQGKPGPVHPDQLKNKIVLTANGTIEWNGTAITAAQLAGLLHQTTRMPIEPELQFEPDADTSYALAARVLNTIKAAGVTRFGFVGNERHRDFGK